MRIGNISFRSRSVFSLDSAQIMDFKKCCVIFYVVASYFFENFPLTLALMNASKNVQMEYAFEKCPPYSVEHTLIWTHTPTLPFYNLRARSMVVCILRNTNAFHVFDTIQFTPFQPLLGVVLPSAASCAADTL